MCGRAEVCEIEIMQPGLQPYALILLGKFPERFGLLARHTQHHIVQFGLFPFLDPDIHPCHGLCKLLRQSDGLHDVLGQLFD